MAIAKLLASKNIIIGVVVIGTVLVAALVLGPGRSPSPAVTPASRIAPPSRGSAEVIPLETILAAFQRNTTAALRQYRRSSFSAHIDAVSPVGADGWAATVTLGDGRATAYIADAQWRAMPAPVTTGQVRTFVCSDWQSGPSGTLTMYGCDIADKR
jgi:hypothetical protein